MDTVNDSTGKYEIFRRYDIWYEADLYSCWRGMDRLRTVLVLQGRPRSDVAAAEKQTGARSLVSQM